MRFSEAEWFTNHKSTWISQAMEATGWGVGHKESTIDILDEFFGLMVEAIETRDHAVLDQLLTRWVKEQVPTEVLGENITIIAFLRQLMQATYITCETFLSGNRLTGIYETAVQLFAYCFERTSAIEIDFRLSNADFHFAALEKSSAKLELSKSAFIQITAHELRTPISLIKGYSSMLESSIPKNEEHVSEHRLLTGINQGANRLNEIINNMLLVAMIDNQRLDLSLQPVWIGKIIKGIRDEHEENLIRRGIKFSIKGVSNKEKMIVGDPLRLKQAFENIVLNAIKFTPDGGRINIDLREHNEKYLISIEDSGIGISKTNQLRLFNRFNYLGDVSHYTTGKTDFKAGGPGLGLYIAKGIIDAHHGSIAVYSPGYDETSNPGTTFTITLPMKQPHQLNP
ncbi:MAG: HAMP domain-containing histidine kinase [Anaerolineae bacterium]|nr:HAMP domain-containing histidine kinase [Anaerolineae bacterium]